MSEAGEPGALHERAHPTRCASNDRCRLNPKNETPQPAGAAADVGFSTVSLDRTTIVMQDFGQIDREIEERAMQTLFFCESTFEGKTCRVSVANYLVFLSLRGPEIVDEIAKLRQVLLEPTPQHLERDLVYLLQARNWRFHDIACVAIACRGASGSLLSELWACLARGSWTSPQLAATAAFVDSEFAVKALTMVEDGATYYKSIVGLAALLTDQFKVAPLSEMVQRHLDQASRLDRDSSGAIAIGWYRNLREVFSAV